MAVSLAPTSQARAGVSIDPEPKSKYRAKTRGARRLVRRRGEANFRRELRRGEV